jgi:putative hemolysin
VALTIVVVGITYFSLILGELVPKRIALANAERTASVVALPMRLVAFVFTPLVVLLDASTRLVLRLLGQQAVSPNKVTEEEIKTLISEAAETGVVEQAERDMIRGVMRLADRPIQALMTPRVDIRWLDLGTAEQDIRSLLRDSPYSRFLVSRGELDEVVGVVQVRDLLAQLLDGHPLDIRQALVQPLFVHEDVDALNALAQLREVEISMAVVVDEYGGVAGLITIEDVLEQIVGEIDDEHDVEEAENKQIVAQPDGRYLVNALTPIADFNERFDSRFSDEELDTVGGMVTSEFGHLPEVGEEVTLGGFQFHVTKSDDRRVHQFAVRVQEA